MDFIEWIVTQCNSVDLDYFRKRCLIIPLNFLLLDQTYILCLSKSYYKISSIVSI